MNVVFARSSNIYDDSRSTKEILALLEKGYNVAVLGWNRDGKAEEQSKKVFSKYTDCVSFKFFCGHEGKGKVDKIISRIKWSRWLKKCLEENQSIDIIHSCDFDTGNTVRAFAKRNKIRYIYDIFDYYVDAHPVPSVIKKIVENKEIKTINDSETCIICTEERLEQISKASPKKVVVIYNSPAVELYGKVNPMYDYVYCGSLYGGRLLAEILAGYENNSQYRFAFAGYGEYAEVASHLSDQFENFSYLGSIPYSFVLDVESKSQVISAIYDPSIRNHRLCAPNKFYEAMALGKPIIVCKGTGIDKIVETNNIGIAINYDSNEFYSALEYLVNNPNESEQMGLRARALYENEYHWDLMKEKLLNIYELVLDKDN